MAGNTNITNFIKNKTTIGKENKMWRVEIMQSEEKNMTWNKTMAFLLLNTNYWINLN